MKTAQKNIIKNEKGIALVLAMVMLVLLTLVGFAAVNNSTTEIALSGNYRLAADSFYVAESGIESIAANDTLFFANSVAQGTTTATVAVGTKTATVSVQFIKLTSVPDTGNGVNSTSGLANQYLIQSIGRSRSGISIQQEMVAKILPSTN